MIKNTEWNELKIYARTADLEKQIREIWNAQQLPEEKLVKSKVVEGGRRQIRLKFWEKAIPVIKEKNNYESFSNANPGTSNMVIGSFGIGGFGVVCTANYDKASVDFYMGKRDRDKNKEAFDILWSHKEEIESTVGAKLHWDRAESFKASWVSYRLENVSIANEADWEKMTQFLADWSNKMRKAMLSYLVDVFPQDSSSGRSQEEIERLQSIAAILREWTIQNKEIIAYLTYYPDMLTDEEFSIFYVRLLRTLYYTLHKYYSQLEQTTIYRFHD